VLRDEVLVVPDRLADELRPVEDRRRLPAKLRRSLQLGLGEFVELTLGKVEVLRPVQASESSQDRAAHVVGRLPVLRPARQALQMVRGSVRREPLALQLAG
jgi:hypothetical protein